MIGMDSLILSTESLVIPHGAGKGLDMLNVRSSLGQRKRKGKCKEELKGGTVRRKGKHPALYRLIRIAHANCGLVNVIR